MFENIDSFSLLNNNVSRENNKSLASNIITNDSIILDRLKNDQSHEMPSILNNQINKSTRSAVILPKIHKNNSITSLKNIGKHFGAPKIGRVIGHGINQKYF